MFWLVSESNGDGNHIVHRDGEVSRSMLRWSTNSCFRLACAVGASWILLLGRKCTLGSNATDLSIGLQIWTVDIQTRSLCCVPPKFSHCQPNMRVRSAFLVLASATGISAHPHHKLSAREIAQHQSISKRCAAKAGTFAMQRKKRSLAKRQKLSARDTIVTVHTESPHFATLQNDTCVLTPEVTAGPYVWPRSETLRQDMRENQPGVPLYLDIGVLDVNTCDPAPDILIDMWHCKSPTLWYTPLNFSNSFDHL